MKICLVVFGSVRIPIFNRNAALPSIAVLDKVEFCKIRPVGAFNSDDCCTTPMHATKLSDASACPTAASRWDEKIGRVMQDVIKNRRNRRADSEADPTGGSWNLVFIGALNKKEPTRHKRTFQEKK